MSIKFTTEGREYTWVGGFGAQFKSIEYGVKEGDTRVIKNKLFYAYTVRKTGWFKREIGWCYYNETSTNYEEITKLEKHMFERMS